MKNQITFQDNSYTKLTNLYAFLIICVLPLLFIPFDFPSPFSLPKMILWIISFVTIVFILFLVRLKSKNPIFFISNQTKEQKWILFVLLLYAVSWCISSLFSIDKVTSLTGIYTFNGLTQLILGISTFLLIKNHYQFQHKHLVYVLVTYSIVSVLSVLQFYGMDPLSPFYGEQMAQLSKNTLSTIGNANQVATCLCVAYIVAALYFITGSKEIKWNRLILVSVFIIFAGNVATLSKAGMIAVAVSLLIAFPLIKKSSIHTKRYIQVIVGSIVIYLVMNITSNAVVMNRILQMFFEAFEIMRGNIHNEYGSNRILIWTNSIELIKHYWTVGSGPDTFKQIYDIAGFNTINQYNEKNVVLSPHNESLRLLITTGITSLIFYWILLISIMKKGLRRIYEDKMMLPLILGLLCYEIKLLFNCSSITDIIIFWVLLAIVFNRATNYELPKCSESSPSSSSSSSSSY